MDKRERFAELDGYRGLAALAVVILHAYSGRFWPSPHYGPVPSTLLLAPLWDLDGAVSAFFVLSGLLLGLPYAHAALTGAPSPVLRTFLARRARRILPLYVVVLGSVWLVNGDYRPAAWVDLGAHLAFLFPALPAHRLTIVLPAWSLGCEVWYYLALGLMGPLVVAACHRCRARHARLTFLMMAACMPLVASLIASMRALGTTDALGEFAPLRRADAFAMGLVLAVVVAARPPGCAPRQARALRLAGLLVCLFAMLGRFTTPVGQAGYFALIGLGFALLIAPGLCGARPWWLLTTRPSQALGALSYGLYLWHVPLGQVLVHQGWLVAEAALWPANLALVLALTLPLATITYFLIERPALRRAVAPATLAARMAPSAGD